MWVRSIFLPREDTAVNRAEGYIVAPVPERIAERTAHRETAESGFGSECLRPWKSVAVEDVANDSSL